MSFVSFSQNYEDVILWRALKDVEAGFYVDVGAWSPDVDSVTRAFYDRGWRGINIEPNPQRWAELLAARDRDVNLGVVASDKSGMIKLYVVADTGLTTADAAIAQQHREAGWEVSAIKVPRRNLSAILDDHVQIGQPIHFLKIDVEGHELEVIRGIDFSRYQPWVILVEATAPNSQIDTSSGWEPVILAAGYRYVYWDGLNRFYLANEHADLATAFRDPPNVFDGFVRSSEAAALAQKQDLERQVQDLAVQLETESQRVSREAMRAEMLQRQIQGLSAQIEAKSQRNETVEAAALRKLSEIKYVTHRSLWERLVFRPSGKPKKALRRALFHKCGKPRGLFKSLILHPDGRPHKPFWMWMSSPEYQNLRSAVRLPDANLMVPPAASPSPFDSAGKWPNDEAPAAGELTPEQVERAAVPAGMRETAVTSGGRLAFFTVVSNNYLHFARTLLQTVALHHSEADVYCVIVDRDLEPASGFEGEFTVLPLEQLNIPDLNRMAFQYDVLEFNTAVKPWAFETLLKRGYEKIIYLDPDIFIYSPLVGVTTALDEGADIIITPHLLAPVSDDKRPTELDIRRAGTYNFGFCAVRQSVNSMLFLHWWQEKLLRDCIVDQDRGIFVDQSWIDLVPGLFENVNILRNPAYNVAYWNVAQRSIQQQPDGSWTADGERLAFFHFSGFNPLSPEAFSKHQNRFTLANLGPAAALARAYASALVANGANSFSKLAYGYGSFADGTAVSDGFRRLYLRNDGLRSLMGEDPFGQSGILVEHAEDKGITPILPITWAMLALYRMRPDLQSSFDLREPEGAARLWDWFITYGSADVPEWVMRRHRELWSESYKTSISSDRLCHALYSNLLDRSPTATELDRLRRMCQTRIGASIALIQVARTPESRHRPRPTRRFKKAMRSIWHRSLADQRLKQTPAEASVYRGTRQGQFRLTGLYPSDAEAIEHGVWAHVDLSIPLGNAKHEKIEILGNYFSSSLERMNGRATLGLDLLLDGRPWTRVDLPGTGEISISEPVPDRLSTATALQIKADNFFVPSAVGDGADHRKLSWRLRKVVSNDTAVFDSGRQPSLLPVTQLFRPQGFNIVGYVFAELGVGEAARTMARAARAAAIPYSLCDVGYQTENRQSDMRAAEHAVDNFFPVDVLYVNADQTLNTLQYLDRTGRPRADYRIGFWHWEQPRLPEAYWSGFGGLNEVWVPTAFVHEAVSAVSPVPVFKVPHAVEFAVDPRWTRASFGIPANRFVVLVMYDFDSYRFRKNPEAAIAAFKRAARGRTDMTLVIKTINSSKHGDDYAALKADVAELDSVVFLDEVFSRDQIYGLEANCDCMLSLHRAEGFGFGPAEMMFLGKPVIATGWSGNMEFMTSENSFPVAYELKPLARPLGAYAAGLDWAEPDIEHAAACLRQVVEDRALAQDIGRRARQTMQTKFSPEAIGKQYLERLSWISMQL